ncbi:MAG: hypothetical protein ACK5M3_15660 [Dysgonomonas sp.]
MKTRIITILAILFFSISFYPQNIKNELIKYRKTNNGLETKTVYQSDNNGRRIRQILYLKDNNNDWSAIQKHEYLYDKVGKLTEVICTEKRKNQSNWETKSYRMIHLYDQKGRLIATKQMETDDEHYLIAIKK